MYSYNEFIEDLNLGHEIEFILNDTHFLISYNVSGCYCIKENEEAQVMYESVEQLLNQVKINGKTLKSLWGSIIVSDVF
ncbi:hypothetical protein DET54_11313 [Paenibacillus pabuli]|uniref:Uncharacterized protein n=1 Tax=Paenibacillus pabuli TaxID=1472 RepID=A0A855XWN6_9BACL|nr:hypothetical protein DET56_107355 [Paenibacillus pabuli]PXW06138.1 hypothetical protein DEU73_107355 [Paenibacillus taichungensis]RAI89730.1 hypothetical protein DET54_11313 [Paenibacillus pabuli]